MRGILVEEKLKLVIVGTGRIAHRAVGEIRVAGGIEIVAVVNPNPEHAKEFADRYGIEGYYASLEECLKDFGEAAFDVRTDTCEMRRDSVDAVYIATPHGTHYEYAKASLLAGKHVICEKPMVLKESEAKELFEIAAKKRLVLMEAIKTAYSPGFKKICEVVESGVIGKVVDIEAAFTRLTAFGCREYNDKENGGSFTEFGSYTMLPIFRFLGTEFEDVTFYSRYAEGDSGVDGYTKAGFYYRKSGSVMNGETDEANGPRKVVAADAMGTAKTGLTVKSEGQLLISGTKGYILVPSPWWLTKYFEVRYEDPSKIDKYECEFEGDGLRYEFTEFLHRCESGIDAVHSEEMQVTARAHVMERFKSSKGLQ